MKLTASQQAAVDHLRGVYIGPEEGAHEVLWTNNPAYQYVAGMLFPREAPESPDSSEVPTHADTEEGDLDEEDTPSIVAESWRPSSTAISFVTDAEELLVTVGFGTYTLHEDDSGKRWERTPHLDEHISLTRRVPRVNLIRNGIELEVGSRWRNYGEAQLVTVHVRNQSKPQAGSIGETSSAAKQQDAQHTMYQVALEVVPEGGGRILEYDFDKVLDPDEEAEELRLRYRLKKTYAVGHGLGADWELAGGTCTKVWLDPMPTHIVPAVVGTDLEQGTPAGRALDLDHLAELVDAPDEVTGDLQAFVDRFAEWVDEERQDAAALPEGQRRVAERLVERDERAEQRMRASIDLLRAENSDNLRNAFTLSMRAMRDQMNQGQRIRGRQVRSPRWRPFQLGFLLVSLSSTVDAEHDDRELVDLIWFPTGGGKTEAYLGLAAIEMFRRRLDDGARGGGTAVITRYSLRLLTSQQFQRTAALICAMELLRRNDPVARSLPGEPFSIGLWVGNNVTPGSHAEALEEHKRLFTARIPGEANKFQVTECPWCRTALVPETRTEDLSKYGVRADSGVVKICCPDEDCQFADGLPVSVVDEELYERPPTFLLATVDKFARLQFDIRARALLGLNLNVIQPSLLIQDELHLLSGPLGTTVAAFEAGLQVLLSRDGQVPKIIASTATIRSSDQQVQGLYGREVAQYPPAGLDEERSFFSQPDESQEGRLYVGIMPQALPQATSVVAAATPVIELPEAIERAGVSNVVKDDYWTSVFYHNSLRELGRTETLVADDVDSRLSARADRLTWGVRKLSADRVVELTSRRDSIELRSDLRRMEAPAGTKGAVDVVLSSNMLSVGIDVSRLALMLMVGQPKTTSEYIQATSRVGRGSARGIIVTLFRPNRARDRSQYENFRGFHQALYRHVEPTSVTPWSDSSRDRSLAGVLVMTIRQALVSHLGEDAAAGEFNLDDPRIAGAVEHLRGELLEQMRRAEPDEAEMADLSLERRLGEWHDRAQNADGQNPLTYEGRGQKAPDPLLKRYGERKEGWIVADSMRSVEGKTAVEIREPYVREEQEG